MISGNEEPQTTILTLPGNTKGHDFVVADLHGNCDLYKKIIEHIKSQPGEHRLFILGDFVDRGPQSIELIHAVSTTLYEQQTDKHLTLYLIRGNHEDFTLMAINGWLKLCQHIIDSKKNLTPHALRLIYREHDKDPVARSIVKEMINLHLANGGEWLYSLFQAEIRNHLISQEKAEVLFDKDSMIGHIYGLFNSLPYIIHVDEVLEYNNIKIAGFNAVHADLPLNDELMKLLITRNINLSNREIHYATSARLNLPEYQKYTIIDDRIRGPESQIAYAGHNITHDPNVAIRRQSNTISLDIRAFDLNQAVLVDHSACHAVLVGELSNKYEFLEDKLDKLIRAISKYLKSNLIHSAEYRAHADMHRAIKDNDADLVQKLLDEGISPFHVYNQFSFINLCTEHNRPELLKLMLSSNLFKSYIDDRHDLYPFLVYAVLKSNTECVQILVNIYNAQRLTISKERNVELGKITDEYANPSILLELRKLKTNPGKPSRPFSLYNHPASPRHYDDTPKTNTPTSKRKL